MNDQTLMDVQAASPLGLALRSAARGRKLHSGHFAFMRAIVQGLELEHAWARYLQVEGHSSDVRLVRSTIAWIREDLAAGAKRERRPGTARLVRLDLSRIVEPGPPLPSLAEFAEENGLEFESESEQIAAFEAEYGRRSQELQRRGRLVARQLEALRWLELAIAQPPRAGDAVAAWFHASLSTHLEAAGIFTLAQLIERVNGIGQRWHAGVKALGRGKASRIVAWLKENRPTIGQGPGAHVELPRLKLFDHELAVVVAPATDIRPLEKFVVPAELDGSRGDFRRPQSQCLLKATTDQQAILLWLRSKHGLDAKQKASLKAARRHRVLGVEQGLDWLQCLSNTQRAYRKEAERFLLWAIIERGRALSSITSEDCNAYQVFLENPAPAERWCGPRSRERWSPLWRPFEGALSASARRQALTILKNLYGFLVDHNYLMGNPWSALSTPATLSPKANAQRSLTLQQWAFVQEQLAQLPETSANQRLQFALPLFYGTGVLISEAVSATLADLRRVEFRVGTSGKERTSSGWMLRVAGAKNRQREVPVPIELVDKLSTYLTSRGLSGDPLAEGSGSAHLLGQASDAAERAPGLMKGVTLDPHRGIAMTTLSRQLKGFFVDCAGVLRARGDLPGALQLSRASAHWMRHTYGMHALAQGVPIEVAQHNLGHASLATTAIYATLETSRRPLEDERFCPA